MKMAVEAAPIIGYKLSHDLNGTGSYFYNNKKCMTHCIVMGIKLS
jgi:hypothetical protein